MLLIVLLAILSLLLYRELVKKPRNFPPGPRCLPIVGNLPLLKKMSREMGGQYLAFAELAKRHKTNVLGLKLGSENVITVFSYETVRAVLTREEFEGRPNNFFLKLRCMGERRGITCTDGETWATHRNFLVRHLRNIGFGKSPMEKMIQEELDEMLFVIKSTEKTLRISRLISPSVLSILFGLIAGTRISRNDPQLNRLLDLFYRRSRAFDMSGGLLSQFPFLRFVAPQFCGYNIITSINKELKSFFMKLINEHRETWSEGREDDVIHAFLTEMHKQPNSKLFTEEHLMMTCLDVFIAGAETTGNTLDYAFLLMIMYPDIQKKVQEALDNNFKNTNGEITYTDRHRVPYVQAVLMECERFSNIVPIIGPRRVLRDTALENYYVPKNTTVLISVRSVMRDVEIWGDPDVFRPERFLNEDGKIYPNEKLCLFGLGKRRCLGETLARSCIFLFFVGILRNYTVMADPESTEKLTLKPLPGITLCPQKYTAKFVKR